MREESEIGAAIREFRKAKGYTLNDLAQATGFSQGYLSKLENSRSAPSLSTLIKIAKALGLGMAEIFGETNGETSITLVKKEQRREMARTGSNFGYTYQALAPHFRNRHMDPYILTDPGLEKDRPFFQHDGEEMFYVLQGTMRFRHGEQEFIVEEGDCIYFDSSVPHWGESIGDVELKCVMMIYNPQEDWVRPTVTLPKSDKDS